MYVANTILYCCSFFIPFPPFNSIHFLHWSFFLMQAQPQSHLAQHSAMRQHWAWLRISRQIACVWLLPLGSLRAGPDRTENTHVTLPSTLEQIYH